VWEFKPFVEDHPQVAWALLKTLAERLRAAQAHEHE
jgi:CRP-like cAMP-binding protein